MKKITILLLIVSIFLVGCNKNTTKKKAKSKPKVVNDIKYKDDNNMPIGIYQDNNSNLIKLNSYSNSFVRGTDIGVFQIFPSNDSNIKYNSKFGDFFYEKWVSFNKKNKIGFSIKFSTTDGNKIEYIILNPKEAMRHANYLEIYLYDDYYHRNDSWYSHVEENEYNDNTLFTSIKLTPGMRINDINSSIDLTVFTYDGNDDFDPDTELYRGNSKYTISVSRTN